MADLGSGVELGLFEIALHLDFACTECTGAGAGARFGRCGRVFRRDELVVRGVEFLLVYALSSG